MRACQCRRRHNYERHHLSQSGLRHLAQHACHDPAKRRGARDYRIPEKSAQPRAADRTDQGHGNSGSRAAAGKRYAVCRIRPCRSQMERRRADRFHAGASDPDQSADCRHAKGSAAMPSIGSGARSSRPPDRFFRQGRR